MSWKKAKLCSVAKIGAGQSAPKDSDFSVNDGLPFIRAGHLEQLIANDNIVALPTINEEKSSKNKLKVLKKGSILFAKSGMSAMMNRAYLIEQDAYYVSHLASVTPNNSVLDSRFCYYFLKHFKTSKLIKDSSYPSIGLPDIENIEIPLPPLSTQKRIAEILDAADDLRRKDQELLRKYDELAQAIFIDMFGDPVKNEKGWEKMIGNQYANKISVGVVIKPASYYVKKGVPALRSQNIRANRITDNNFVYFSQKTNDEILFKSKIYTGDVLIVRTGQPGTAAVVEKEFNEFNCIDMLILSPKKEVVSPYYLAFFFNSDAGKKHIASNQKGQIQQHFNVGDINRFSIPIPPVNLQLRFENLLFNLRRQSENQSSGIINQLFESLLQKAFKGELVK